MKTDLEELKDKLLLLIQAAILNDESINYTSTENAEGIRQLADSK